MSNRASAVTSRGDTGRRAAINQCAQSVQTTSSSAQAAHGTSAAMPCQQASRPAQQGQTSSSPPPRLGQQCIASSSAQADRNPPSPCLVSKAPRPAQHEQATVLPPSCCHNQHSLPQIQHSAALVINSHCVSQMLWERKCTHTTNQYACDTCQDRWVSSDAKPDTTLRSRKASPDCRCCCRHFIRKDNPARQKPLHVPDQ